MATSAIMQIRRIKALDLRLAGASYRTIAAACDVSLRTAMTDVLAALKETMAEPAAVVRQQELERLDRIMLRHYAASIATGDIRHTEIVLKIMDRRARLLGLDAPVRVALSLDDKAQVVASKMGVTIEEARAAVMEAEVILSGG